jgi:hypothetical protein
MNRLVDVLEMLSDQLDELQNDKISPATANAVCRKAGEMIRSVRVQVKCGKHAAELSRSFQLKSSTSI